MTPEAFQQWFDAQLVFIIFIWGLAVKYVPGIAKLPNAIIGWGGVLIACVMKLAAPEAHAATTDGLARIPWWISAPIQVFWASNGYERFIRPILERLGIYKAHAKTVRGREEWTWAPQAVGVPDKVVEKVEAAKAEAQK